MRVVFLDIDGVLNHPGTYCHDAPWRHQEGDPLPIPVEPECVARLNRLIAATGSVVVISSSWRLFAHWQDLGPALARHGLVGDVVSETPDLCNDPVWLDAWRTREGAPFHYKRLERGWEIAEWLARNPGVSSWVVLDDSSDMEGVKHRFIQTDPVTGLSDSDVDRAVTMLVEP